MYSALYEKLTAREEKLSLIGLGYVGMPIAVAFAKKIDVIGFDLNKAKIDLYKNLREPIDSLLVQQYHSLLNCLVSKFDLSL